LLCHVTVNDQTSSKTTADVNEDELFDEDLRALTTRFLSCNHLLPTRLSRVVQCRLFVATLVMRCCRCAVSPADHPTLIFNWHYSTQLLWFVCWKECWWTKRTQPLQHRYYRYHRFFQPFWLVKKGVRRSTCVPSARNCSTP